jgi:hypothetical protein
MFYQLQLFFQFPIIMFYKLRLLFQRLHLKIVSNYAISKVTYSGTTPACLTVEF